jgi:hypothetical protein
VCFLNPSPVASLQNAYIGAFSCLAMRIQLLSDLHLETESFEPCPAPEAEVLVLAGDIDTGWNGLERFANWPVPVLMVAGNHEFDRRDIGVAQLELKRMCERQGIVLLEKETCMLTDDQGRRIRFVGTTRWCDFDLFGASERSKAMRAAQHYLMYMASTLHGQPLNAPTLREHALQCRAWLQAALASSDQPCDRTVVMTHYAPSILSADPRYGRQPSTASFCNADDDLLAGADVWIHGHLHCRFDYTVAHAKGQTRVICNARGHSKKYESANYQELFCFEV